MFSKSKDKKEKESKEFNLREYGNEAKEKLVKLSVESLKPFWYEDNLVPGLTLYLYEHPDAVPISLLTDNAEFRESLLNACREKSVRVEDDFKWEVKIEKPQNSEAKEIRKGIYLLVSSKKTKAGEAEPMSAIIPTKAVITALKGNLVKKQYSLNAKKSKVFNIGRGENPQLAEGIFHKNHIAIVDDDRKVISRQHACIIFDPQKGFCLRAYKGGASLLSNNSTILFRDGKMKKEFSNTKGEEPLQNGDQIKLGIKSKESVVLLFEIEKPMQNKKNDIPS